MMTLTPHVVRRPAITEEDLRSFLLGGDASPVLFEAPAALPSFQTPPKPSPEPPKAEPIRPPAPPASSGPQNPTTDDLPRPPPPHRRR